MTKLSLAIGLMLISIQFFICTGCKTDIKREFIMLDSLDKMILKTEKNIEIDVSTIKARQEEIERNINLIKRFYTDTFSEELGNNLQKYKGVMKIYKYFLNNQGTITQENAELRKQIATLRNSVVHDKISKDDFRKYYDKERGDITKNLELSERSGKIVFEIEPEYQRLNRQISDILELLASKNDEVKEILK